MFLFLQIKINRKTIENKFLSVVPEFSHLLDSI